jgi:hypothetical protein
MNPIRLTVLALLLIAPTALLAHPGHAPGEPEHWVIAALFAVLSLAALALWQRGSAARNRARRPGERE